MTTGDDEIGLALSPRVRWRAVGDEGVLVHLDRGRVLVVNAVGLHLLQRLASRPTRASLLDSMVDGFECTRDQAQADLDAFLAELESESALERDGP